MILKIKVRCNPDAADPKQTMGVTVRVWGGAERAWHRSGLGARETAGGLKEREAGELGQDAGGFPGKWSSHAPALGL